MFEVWAMFEDGITTKVETHKTERTAMAAIGAMNNQNKNDLAEGYGFPHGVPTYMIIKR